MHDTQADNAKQKHSKTNTKKQGQERCVKWLPNYDQTRNKFSEQYAHNF